ncbi:MAG TPA: metal-dependent hydrolase [Pirellulaceae bacterium]|nr:metal-dependent hydrolase [Pirellulaceae bacterium]HMO92840.1 metal-dependent hydrolase [Pirellulaceae bacterium]HMP69418.1 metal-dependent hydrolase [Pirellulaceae bacterium]
MADFKTHITTSTLLGIGYGTGAYFVLGVPIDHCLIAAGLCSISGMLPDLDSDSGVPVREMLCLVSVIVPMLMVPRFVALGLHGESMVIAAGLVYLGIRFGIGNIFKKYTVHRGMWHSIPAALIAGMFMFIVCLSNDVGIRLFKSWAVVLGFISHLLLDEIYSVDWQGRRIRVKKSFGTAMKFFSKRPWANVSTYAKLILLAVIIAADEVAMNYFGREKLDVPISARDWFQDYLNGNSPQIFR